MRILLGNVFVRGNVDFRGIADSSLATPISMTVRYGGRLEQETGRTDECDKKPYFRHFPSLSDIVGRWIPGTRSGRRRRSRRSSGSMARTRQTRLSRSSSRSGAACDQPCVLYRSIRSTLRLTVNIHTPCGCQRGICRFRCVVHQHLVFFRSRWPHVV